MSKFAKIIFENRKYTPYFCKLLSSRYSPFWEAEIRFEDVSMENYEVFSGVASLSPISIEMSYSSSEAYVEKDSRVWEGELFSVARKERETHLLIVGKSYSLVNRLLKKEWVNQSIADILLDVFSSALPGAVLHFDSFNYPLLERVIAKNENIYTLFERIKQMMIRYSAEDFAGLDLWMDAHGVYQCGMHQSGKQTRINHAHKNTRFSPTSSQNEADQIHTFLHPSLQHSEPIVYQNQNYRILQVEHYITPQQFSSILSLDTEQDPVFLQEERILKKEEIEALEPDLRHYQLPILRGRIIKVYPTSAGHGFVCDVQIVRGNHEDNNDWPLLTQIPMPLSWSGGSHQGMILSPTEDPQLEADVGFIEHDQNRPTILNLTYASKKVPIDVHPGEFKLSQGAGNFLHWKTNGSRESKQSADDQQTIGGDQTIIIAGTQKMISNGREDRIQGEWQQTVTNSSTLNYGDVDWNSGTTHVNTGSFQALADGEASLGGNSLNLFSLGGPVHLLGGHHSNITAPSLTITTTNAATPIAENAFLLQAMTGHIQMMTQVGNFEIQLTAGLFKFSNATGSLYDRLEKNYQFQKEQLQLLADAMQNISQIVVGTGTGPSSKPFNAGTFLTIQGQANQKIAEIDLELGVLATFTE